MEAETLAGREADDPHALLVGFGEQLGADATVRALRLLRELLP